ncbi:MAG: DNA polymerase I [Lachnospiraceae bacterium]|nr:DNA polymerase I [Lachnospiraceae bacterium]
MDKGYLLLIDGSSLLSTQYYGNLPREILFAKTEEDKKKFYHKIMQTRKGVYTNAVYGFMRTLIKIINEQKPEYLAIAWDKSRNTFRRDIYPEYKGNRGETPAPLKQQFELCEDILSKMNIPQFMHDRYEADDFCGSLAAKFEKELPVKIFTKDNDYLQLVSENTNLWLMHASQDKTEELYKKYGIKPDGSVPERAFNLTPELVKAEFGVEPSSINSLKGLQGDSSDNIKGVPGIGPTTAVALIAKYKNVAALYDEIRGLDVKQQKEKAKEWKEELGISRSPFGPLLKQSDEELVGEKAAFLSEELATIKRDIDLSDVSLESLKLNIDRSSAVKCFEELEFKTLAFNDDKANSIYSSEKYEVISDFNDFIALCEGMKKKPVIGMAIAADDNQKRSLKKGGSLYGAAFCDGEKTVYVKAEGFISGDFIADRIREIIAAGVKLSVFDLKRLLRKLDMDEQGKCFDCGIAAYLIDPLAGKYDFDMVAASVLSERPQGRAELLGKMSIEDAAAENAENLIKLISFEALTAFACCEKLDSELSKSGMEKLYYEIELPLISVLNAMEKEGIYILKDELVKFGEKLSGDIKRLEKEIYEACGEEFNINSPKQLGVILFEKLRLPYGKKTKTGYSTSADVLEKLKLEDPVVEKILDYRQLTKLKSTYAEGLYDVIEEDGRIHTSFNQTVTATGRLSSTEPNLQNIPIRVELGRELRKVFVPKDGYCFVDADYSQIELRILAAMSADEKLISAYRNSEDIHRATASAVFKVPMEEVSKELRSKAKAVNFGIVYGISSFGLGEGLNISRKEADEYIKSYFATYPGVKNFLDGLVEAARRDSCSVTLFGRRRPIPELESANFMQRSFGERIAMNSPVQGTAADIIKIAMLRVADRLKREGLESRLLLQIHDELLVEAKLSEAETVEKILLEEMRNAAELAVSLEVEVERGMSWYDAH